LNGSLLDSDSFYSLASAQAFFSKHLIGVSSGGGPADIVVTFDETMSSAEGFSFDYAAASASASPLPSSWTMMLLGLAGLGLIAYRRTKTGAAAISMAYRERSA
jgi:hypothetical protein